MIGTYADLQSAVADYLNQTNLTAQIPDFINRAHVQIQEFTGPLYTNGDPSNTTLQNPTDTNALLQYDPYIYLDGAVAEGFKYGRDTAQYATFLASFKSRLQRLAATGFMGLSMPPAIKPPPGRYRMRYLSSPASNCDPGCAPDPGCGQ